MTVEEQEVHPYPGLRPFKYSDSRFFYGRKNIIQDIASDLVENKSVYIVGPSGTGKSSLAYAGLIPALQSGIIESNARRWRTVIFRPSGGPTANLAGALYDSYHSESDDGKSGINAGNPMISPANSTIKREDFVKLSLSENTRPFFKEVRRFARTEALVSENGELEENLLIIADQFEELFRLSDLDRDSDYSENNMARLKKHRNELDHFVKIFLGLRAFGGRRTHTLVTMRTEYLVDCEINASLLKDVDRHLFLVRKLNNQELSEIITHPARQLLGRTTKEGHPTVHQDLVERLIEELHQEAESYLSSGRYRLPDQLPLLQHALSQIWQNKHLDGDENDMSLEDYINICSKDTPNKQGSKINTGLSLALSTHLNEIYNSVQPKMKNAVKRVFLSLVEFGPQDKWAVRRRVKLSRLMEETNISKDDFYAIAKAFQTESGHFIYVPRQKHKNDEKFDPIVDISHESLLRHWNKLSGWIGEEGRDIIIASACLRQNRLTGSEIEQASEWKERKVAEGTYSRAWFSRHLTNIAPDHGSLTPKAIIQNIEETINKSVQTQALEAEFVRRKKKAKYLGIISAVSAVLVVAFFSIRQRTIAAENLAIEYRAAAAESDRKTKVAEAETQARIEQENANIARAKLRSSDESKNRIQKNLTETKTKLDESLDELKKISEKYIESKNSDPLQHYNSLNKWIVNQRIGLLDLEGVGFESNNRGDPSTECSGYIWVGDDENPKVYSNDGKLVSNLKAGDKLEVLANLVLRDLEQNQLDESGYQTGKKIGNVVNFVEVEALSSPQKYLTTADRVRRSYVRVNAPRRSCYEITITYPSDREQYLAEQTRQHLREDYGYDVLPIKIAPSDNDQVKIQFPDERPITQADSTQLKSDLSKIYLGIANQVDLDAVTSVFLQKVTLNQKADTTLAPKKLKISIGHLPEENDVHWTPWYNRFHPKDKIGISLIDSPGSYCENPLEFECRYLSDHGKEVPSNVCSKDHVCLPANGFCEDLEVRLKCPPT